MPATDRMSAWLIYQHFRASAVKFDWGTPHKRKELVPLAKPDWTFLYGDREHEVQSVYDGALCTDATTYSVLPTHTIPVSETRQLVSPSTPIRIKLRKTARESLKMAACWTLNCPIFNPQNDRGAIARNRRIQAASPDDGSKW